MALRGAGEQVHTLAEVFGEEAAQQLEDESWIAHAGLRGWAALTKDKRIRHRPVEREAVLVHRVPLFALSNGNLGFTEMAAAFMAAMSSIHRICADAECGGIWVVHRDGRVELLWLAQAVDDGGDGHGEHG